MKKGAKFAVVLVGPQGDANIGAAARAMKNFGITDLRLVDAVRHRTKRAYMWAVGARDLLDGAKSFGCLDDALEDTVRAVAFTRRLGRMRKLNMEAGDLAAWVGRGRASGITALVFGREDKGLTNAEVNRCDATVTIPTSLKLPSMNLAQSVLIACYELTGKKGGVGKTEGRSRQEFVSRKEIAAAVEMIGTSLDALGYEDSPGSPLKSKILHRFERLFGRGGLAAKDIGMWKGLCARIEQINHGQK